MEYLSEISSYNETTKLKNSYNTLLFITANNRMWDVICDGNKI